MEHKLLLVVISLFILMGCNQSRSKDRNAAGPSELVVTTHQQVTPVLVGKDANAVLRIGIAASGKAQTVSAIPINTDGTTDINDIQQVDLFYTGADSTFSTKNRFGKAQKPAKMIQVSGEQQLQQGTNYFWVSYRLKPGTNLLHKVDAGLQQVEFAGGNKIRPEIGSPPTVKKVGLALRQHGDDGVDTYRIPGLATTNDGTLIAVYDIRYESAADLQADIDIGMSRSTDGGQHWEPMQVIMNMNEQGGLPEAQNGVGDPSVLVDDGTGTIWVAALWTHGMAGKRAWNASGQGLSPDETGQFMLVKSEDDGKTWSDPINITRQVKKPEWRLMLQGPGKGITMSDGTLVFPAQFRAADGKPYSTIIYSKDHGKTWHVGTGAKSNTTEAQVVELSTGSLMLNMRDNRGGARSVYTTDDLGQTWRKHPTSRSALIEPVCQASLIAFPAPKESSNKQWLLFSNPNSTKARKNMTIKLSSDDGMIWPKEQQLLLNENQGYGYSCMTVIDHRTIGILYEGVKDLYFQKVRLRELKGRKKSD